MLIRLKLNLISALSNKYICIQKEMHFIYGTYKHASIHPPYLRLVM